MTIIVDADASPKKDDIIKLAGQYSLTVLLVSSISHYSTTDMPEWVKRIWVDKGSDLADFKIVALAKEDDIVLTNDFGLASMLLPKRCRVLHHDGYEYTESIIQQLIDGRHLSAKERRTNKRSRVKSLAPFASEDQQPFEELLERIIKEQLIGDNNQEGRDDIR